MAGSDPRPATFTHGVVFYYSTNGVIEMATPKAPQDHKAKVETAKETDIVIKVDGKDVTVRGYRVTVDDVTVDVEKDAVQSWEFAEAASDQDIVRLARIALGDSYQRVRDSFRDERGRVAITPLAEFVNGVIGALPNS